MKQFWLICTLACISFFGADDIGGFWKSLNDEGKPQCVFGIYEHEGVHYGKVIGTYDPEGEMKDTLYKPISRAEGVVGTPPLCGLDILYGFQDNGSSYDGRIVDPTKGNIYRCEVWRQSENLIVRGKLFIFGKNLTWYPVKASDFPKGFKLPNMKKFTPNIPEVN